MLAFILVIVAALAALVTTYIAVRCIKPESFTIRAEISRLFSFTLDLRSPAPSNPIPQPHPTVAQPRVREVSFGDEPMNVAQVDEERLRNRWPPDDAIGIAAVGGRTFHISTQCHRYRREIQDAIRSGRSAKSVETMKADEARMRDKIPCQRCWNFSEPTH